MLSAEKVVPDSLYMLIRLLCAGDMADDSNEELDLHLIKKKDSKHFPRHRFSGFKRSETYPETCRIGLAVHLATCSKELVQLLSPRGTP